LYFLLCDFSSKSTIKTCRGSDPQTHSRELKIPLPQKAGREEGEGYIDVGQLVIRL